MLGDKVGSFFCWGRWDVRPILLSFAPAPETFRSSKFPVHVSGGEKEGFATRAGPGATPPSERPPFGPPSPGQSPKPSLSQPPTSGQTTPGRVQRLGAAAPAALRLRHLARQPRSLGSFICYTVPHRSASSSRDRWRKTSCEWKRTVQVILLRTRTHSFIDTSTPSHPILPCAAQTFQPPLPSAS
jgi:hypothetical protein